MRPVSATKGRTCSAAAAYSSYIFGGVERIGSEQRVGDGVLLRAGGLNVRLEQSEDCSRSTILRPLRAILSS